MTAGRFAHKRAVDLHGCGPLWCSPYSSYVKSVANRGRLMGTSQVAVGILGLEASGAGPGKWTTGGVDSAGSGRGGNGVSVLRSTP